MKVPSQLLGPLIRYVWLMLPHTCRDVFSYIIWRGHFWHPIWIFAKFWISPALWGVSPIFLKIAIFAQIASLQWAGTFSPLSPALWRFPQNLHFRPNRQSPRGRGVFRHYRQPSGDFRQNRQFRQYRQSPRGHVWHPTQIARGWRFFAISAIFAIACNS